EPARGDVELSDARRAAGAARSEHLLARTPFAPGEHQQDQGDRPLVQSELHPEDEGRESDRNPGEPYADPSPARIPEAVAEAPADVGRPFQGRQDDGPERPVLQLSDVDEPPRLTADEPPSWGAPEPPPNVAAVPAVAATTAAPAALAPASDDVPRL